MRDPLSPCTRICRIDPQTGQCVGCRRTLDEIMDWPLLSAEAKNALLGRLALRGPRTWP